MNSVATKLLVAGCVLLLFVATANSQSYTPPSYRIVDQPLEAYKEAPFDDGDATHHQFEAMAANGYGQWVFEQYSSYAPGWRLLANSSSDSNTATAPITPNEIVEHGTFAEATTGRIKVAANLDGSVRYVWHDLINPEFVVEGFNDHTFTGLNTNENQIDVRFLNFSQNDTTRHLITKPIFAYPHVVLPADMIGDSIDDPVWKDHFDIAMDKNFLYIVYTIPTVGWTPLLYPIDQKYSVVVKAMNLRTQVVTTYAYPSAYGHRPTISCDVRNAPDTATFDVAYLSYDGSKLFALHCQKGIYSVPTAMVNSCYGPIVTDLRTYDPLKVKTAHFNVWFLHARIMTSSVPGGWGTTPPAKAMYALRHAYLYTDSITHITTEYADLVLYKYDNTHKKWADSCTYVEGVNVVAPRGAPFDDDSLHYLIPDIPLTCFANPYDGQKDSDQYNEYHCLYQLYNNYDRYGNHTNAVGKLYPLFIVHDDDNGLINATDPPTRTQIGRKITHVGPVNDTAWIANPQPGNYCAAVNQMGIHPRWYLDFPDPYFDALKTSSFYARDIRRFDERIDENTLATYDCYVGDGTSHNGIDTPMVRDHKFFTLWTEPIQGVKPTNNGLVLPTGNPSQPYFHNGRLIFEDDSVRFTIGPSTNNATQAVFTTFPNVKFVFKGAGQGILLDEASAWNYWGYVQNNNSFTNGVWDKFSEFDGPSNSQNPTAYIKLQGGGDFEFTRVFPQAPDALFKEAQLNIKGGAMFKTPDNVRLDAQFAEFNFFYKPAYFPIGKTTTNRDTTGLAAFHGQTTLDRCFITSGIPKSQGIKNVFTIKKNMFSGSSSNGLTAERCQFLNHSDGMARLGFNEFIDGSSSYCTKDNTIDGGNFYATQIGGKINPPNFMFVGNTLIDSITKEKEAGIWFNGASLATATTVTITNNHFGCGDPFSTGNFAKNTNGIYLRNMGPDGKVDKITISDNSFTEGNANLPSGDTLGSAITFMNAAGNAVSNEVSGIRYRRGIQVTKDTGSATGSYINVFICNNLLTNCGIAGISTDAWHGIAKLNLVSFNKYGHLSGKDDAGTLLFNRYHHNFGAGIFMSVEKNSLDLSGSHTGGDDYAAFNTIDHNTGFAAYGSHAQIDMIPTTPFVPQPILILGTDTGTVTQTFGRNNIVTWDSINVPLVYYNVASFSITDTPRIGIHSNWWGHCDPDTLGVRLLLTDTSNSRLVNIIYHPVNPVCDLVPNHPGFSVDCGVGFDLVNKHKNQNPSIQSIQDTNADLCYHLFTFGQQNVNGNPQLAYDTLRLAMETCPHYEGTSFGHAYRYFPEITGANDLRVGPGEQQKMVDYREWLKKVLYYNTDQWQWYCGDIEEIMHTLIYYEGIGGPDYKGKLAVMKYVVESGKCPKEFFGTYQDDIDLYWHQAYSLWQDSVQDPNLTPFDSTLPSLGDHNLEILYGQNSVTHSPGTVDLSAIVSVTASPNPISREAELTYILRSTALLKLEVYDALGKQISEQPLGFKSEGRYSIPLNSSGWSSGTYYARLSTITGETVTVKLVKQ